MTDIPTTAAEQSLTSADTAGASAPASGLRQGVSGARLVLHAAVAFVAAHMLVVLVHELAHVVAGLVIGHGGVLYPFAVVHPDGLGRGEEAFVLLAAPAFSLLVGLLALVVTPFRRGRGFAHLLWTWFAFVSVMQGAGYLLLTPFGLGDTGMAAALYGSPPLVVIPAGLLGGLATVWLAVRFAVPALRHTTGELPALRAFTFYPWLIGSVVVVALAALYLALVDQEFSAGEVFAVMMGAFSIGVFAPMAMPFTVRARTKDPTLPGSEPLVLGPVPVAGLVLVLALVAVNAMVLVPGLAVG